MCWFQGHIEPARGLAGLELRGGLNIVELAYWLQAGYISSSPAVSARLVTKHGLEASYPCGYSRKNILLLVDPVTL